MHLIPIFIAVVVVLTGVFFSQRNTLDIETETETPEVLSEEKEEEVAPSNSPTSLPTNPPQPTDSPTAIPQQESSNISDFKYPNVTVISSSQNSLSLESSDDSNTITDWYKNKINSLGMNVKTFVVTSANDKVLNKLVGAEGNTEISVEISQENSSSPVLISVTVQ